MLHKIVQKFFFNANVFMASVRLCSINLNAPQMIGNGATVVPIVHNIC